MSKIIITEDEKDRIKSLYGVNEQDINFLDALNPFAQILKSLGKKTNSDASGSSENKIESVNNTDMANFKEVTKKVVEKLEGGYYNPEWHYKPAMGRSGETMFGIDRKHGGKINETPAGQKFWSIIDKHKNKTTWKHGYDGGQFREELLNLVADVMKPQYESNASKYLSPESIKIVNSDPRLLFHFIYASWNGSGWFKKFATKFNDEVKKGVKSPDKLVDVAMSSRTDSGNSLIAQSGKKIESFIQNIA